jgi:hypothetical protein
LRGDKQTVLKIDSLTSKGGSFNCRFKYLQQQFFDNIIQNTPSEIPNILIVCSHKKRIVDDLPEIINNLQKGVSPLLKKQFHIRIVFDEPDINIKIITECWSKMTRLEIDNTNITLTFVTATPTKQCVQLMFQIAEECSTTVENTYYNDNQYDELCEHYRFFDSHEQVVLNNPTMNPLEYVQDVFNRGLINENEQVTVFAPAHNTKDKKDVGSHQEMVEFFLRKEYSVLLLNGSFKGILTPSGSRVSLDDLNKIYKLSGELRDVLRAWRTHNTENLAIVGNTLVQRGVTFNTNGFNFSHMIISNYHANQINFLVQMMGRATGSKEYVDVMKVISTNNVFELYRNYFSAYHKLKQENPEFYNEDDFQEINDVATKKSFKTKCGTDDFAYTVVKNIEEAVNFVRTQLNIKGVYMKERVVPQTLKGPNGEAPDLQRVIDKKSGLNKNNKYRICPLASNEYVVYWRPSFFKK